MTTEPNAVEQEVKKTESGRQSSSMDAVYAFGLIGAWIFYVGRAASFREGVLGVLKGFIWPVTLVHGLLVMLEDE